MKHRLEEIARRLDDLAARGPSPPRLWERVARPVLRRMFARPQIETAAIASLVQTPS